MNEQTLISTRVGVLIVIIAIAAVFLPMAIMGIPDGFDLLQHMRFAASYDHAIRIGEMIPKWDGPDNFGFGSIGVRYYPPLPYIVIALVHMATGDWYTSFWTTAFAWILAGSLGVFIWIKEHAPTNAALIAALVYVILPFHTFEIYQAVLYAEFAATGLLPFCFLALTRLCRRGGWTDAAFFAIVYALLVLTHIPSAMIGTAGMVIYGLAMLEWRSIVDRLIKLSVAGVFVIGSTAFHLAKAIPELNWVQHNSPKFFTQGSYDYRGLLFPIYFSAPYVRYIQKLLWNLDLIVGVTVVAFAIGAVTLFARRSVTAPDEKRLALVASLTAITSIFFLSIASATIWDAVPTLQKIQFPWRWLELTSLMTAVVVGLGSTHLFVPNGKPSRLGVYALLSLALAMCLFDVSQQIIPSSPLDRQQFQRKIDGMYNEEACDCWWPIWARREAFDDRSVSAVERVADFTSRTDERLAVHVAPGEPASLRVPVFYHPYWRAVVNGQPAAVVPDANGAITLSLPAVDSIVDLTFTEPPYLAPLRYVAVVLWSAVIIFAVLQVVRFITRRKRRSMHDPPEIAQSIAATSL